MPTALEFFTATPRKHNCAQAVMAAHGGSQQDVEDCAFCGGGRAPDGLCGALYAAIQLHPEAEEAIKLRFATTCGALTCREIKMNAKTPCADCVANASAILDTL